MLEKIKELFSKPEYNPQPITVFSLPHTELPINLIEPSGHLPVEEVAKVIGSDKVILRKGYSPVSMPWNTKPEGRVSIQDALGYLCELAYDRVVSELSVFRGTFSGKPIYGIEMKDTSGSSVGIEVFL